MDLNDLIGVIGFKTLKVIEGGPTNPPVPGAFYAPMGGDSAASLARRAYGDVKKWRLLHNSQWNQTHVVYTDDPANPCKGTAVDPKSSKANLSICASKFWRMPNKWSQGQVWSIGATTYPILWIPTLEGLEPDQLDQGGLPIWQRRNVPAQGSLKKFVPGTHAGGSVYKPPTTVPGLFDGGDLSKPDDDMLHNVPGGEGGNTAGGGGGGSNGYAGGDKTGGGTGGGTVTPAQPASVKKPGFFQKAGVGWVVGGIVAATLVGTYLFRRKK